MKLDRLALIAAVVAGVLWLGMVMFGMIAAFADNPVLGVTVGLPVFIGVYILARLVLGRMRTDDPFDRIER